MPSPRLIAAAASTRSADDVRKARRKAALMRLRAAGDGVSPALMAEGQASLASAFSLSDALWGRPR